ncbi:5-oxoprolinase subunit PxpA [Paenibacillus sp.]|uniref:LamB/YcsF family protein n=1 Tax=Paenibacillus sp. TaxID=58172 RepID=UPI002D6B2730|nr:5-oxoprolinase subunit PxpA [Paenibacillus sp.]HZG85086.1 5-oxoprolinase subunit PxpA [Paenibacillus sp.]
MKTTIDLNCDMGEGFGAYSFGNDEALLRWISSANVACGFHAGDPSVMRRTVKLCLERGVRIGAHPGLPDRQGFGRRTMALTAEETFDITLYQIGALQAIAKAEGGTVVQVKPHGALYHMAEEDEAIAKAIAEATRAAGETLALVGLSGGRLVATGRSLGLRVREEAFADRAYAAGGGLAPRSLPGAVLADPTAAAAQALRLAQSGVVATLGGAEASVNADTICIHGDGPHAALHAEAIYKALTSAGIRIGGGGHDE